MAGNRNGRGQIMDRQELIRAFEQVPTSNAADALAKLGIPGGVIDAGLHPLSAPQRRAAGFAVTLRQMSRSRNAEGAAPARHGQVIDEILGEGDMLVIDAGGRTDACTGGGLMALRAKIRGASGWVVNGAVRDIEDIRALGFPVHLKGSSPAASTPLQTVGINIPVEIGGVQICPGDIVLTDETGIVVIPPIQAEAVLLKAQEIGRAEAEAERLLREGLSIAQVKKEAKL